MCHKNICQVLTKFWIELAMFCFVCLLYVKINWLCSLYYFLGKYKIQTLFCVQIFRQQKNGCWPIRSSVRICFLHCCCLGIYYSYLLFLQSVLHHCRARMYYICLLFFQIVRECRVNRSGRTHNTNSAGVRRRGAGRAMTTGGIPGKVIYKYI